MSRTTRLALALLAASWLVLFGASSRIPLGPMNRDYSALVNQSEDLIRNVARDGVGFLAGAEARTALEPLTKRPLAPLLSAWSALSVGRLGLLDGSTSVRLPWLVLAGIVPLSLFLLLVERWGTDAALGAAIWLVLSPGFVSAALSVRPSALAVWSGWLVVVACVRAARERAPRVRAALLVACGGIAWTAFGMSYAAVWALPLLLVHAWGAHASATLHEAARGRLPIPAPVLIAMAALPAAVLAFDPLLWHAEVPTMIRRVFDEEDAVKGVAPRIAPLVLPGLVALAGLTSLAAAALARRFATGEFRPAKDRSSIGLLLTVALLAAAVCAGLGAVGGLEFGGELLRPILACLVAIGAAASGVRVFARYPRWAGAALLLLTLVVR